MPRTSPPSCRPASSRSCARPRSATAAATTGCLAISPSCCGKAAARFAGRPPTFPKAECWCATRRAKSSRSARRSNADLSGIGADARAIVGRSSLGLHVEFTALEASAESALHERLACDPRREPGIRRSRDRCGRDGRRWHSRKRSTRGKLTREALFDTDYVPIEGTNPQQFRTRSLDVLEDAAAADPGAAARARQAHDFLRRGRPQRLSAGAQQDLFQAAEGRTILPGTPRTAATAASSTTARACVRRATCGPI